MMLDASHFLWDQEPYMVANRAGLALHAAACHATMTPTRST